MNAVQIHLVMNHVPVLAPMVAAALLVTGLAAKSPQIMRVGLAALFIGALFVIPVFLTGEPVEDVVKKLPGVAESRIETHEDAAKGSLVLLGAVGLVGLATLCIYRRRAIPVGVGGAVLLLSLLAAGHVAWTAHLGGQIRHSELSAATGAGLDAGGWNGGAGQRAGSAEREQGGNKGSHGEDDE